MNLSFFRGAFLALCAAVSSPIVLAHSYEVGAIKVGHPWARPTVAGQTAGGGYLKLKNSGKTADRLVSVSSAAAERVELHTMKLDGDVMRMRQLDAIELPPGASVVLEPGGDHLMLLGLKAPLELGRSIPLKLTFEKAGDVMVEVKVEKAPASKTAPAAGHADHHKH
jgi:hypothetical protein